jgi:hypothetical protein
LMLCLLSGRHWDFRSVGNFNFVFGISILIVFHAEDRS